MCDRAYLERVANRCSLLYGISVDVADQEEWMDRKAASVASQYADMEPPYAN
jgi:hypothetical protein